MVAAMYRKFLRRSFTLCSSDAAMWVHVTPVQGSFTDLCALQNGLCVRFHPPLLTQILAHNGRIHKTHSPSNEQSSSLPETLYQSSLYQPTQVVLPFGSSHASSGSARRSNDNGEGGSATLRSSRMNEDAGLRYGVFSLFTRRH